ncbi:MAG: tRNA (adenosine(37)-N6)-threonylcarbamoyltransferase complex ATPase subunit type 1 TsaE [bacterium]|nr:tRNA (adenosine(37)-N6)-threonylcarbamoyltransferase complex ATPase subunit type 1 TsaE [bacterium]
MKKTIKSLKEMDTFASEIVNFLNPNHPMPRTATVLALRGDLGSGKTAFVKSLGKALGLRDNITSPTFVIMKSYQIIEHSVFNNLVHIDAYRIEEKRELEILGWREIIADPKNLVVVEWPERVAKIIPKNVIKINFEFVDEATRRVCIKK